MIIFLTAKDGEALYDQQRKRPGVDNGSDHQLPVAKFRLKLKKVGKTTRPFRYDLNHIPYDYTVKVTNRFKGLDLIECLKNYGQRFVTLEAVIKTLGIKTSPRKRRQNGNLMSLYKYLRKEEKLKAEEKRKDVPI